MTAYEQSHRTVLRTEAVDALSLRPGSVAVDATLGVGGHAEVIAEVIGKEGTLVMLDADGDTLSRTKERMLQTELRPTFHFTVRNFKDIAEVVREFGMPHVDGVLADLGWNSEQFEQGGRGFSFKETHYGEPLLMTYGAPESYLFTAADILNGWGEEDIANVLFGYGEERYARRIAKRIVEGRERAPLRTVGDLLVCIEEAVPKGYRHGRIHPATKTFQALRIAVNDELQSLRAFITGSLQVLRPGGRLAIITFHSIEDRIVKHAFREERERGAGTIITKKPIVPSREELTRNPRARSAKLRIFEKGS